MLVWVVYVLSIFTFSGCVTQVNSSLSETNNVMLIIGGVNDFQTRNLQKLCKVWGYVKYTHRSFLQGLNDYDQELLDLIPQIYAAASDEEVNIILYGWFVSLGDSGYDSFNIVETMTAADVTNKRFLAEIDWLFDETYLGKPLASVLPRFLERMNTVGAVTERNVAKAPVTGFLGTVDFSNEKKYYDMDYNDTGYRLLGLFRLWNVVEYYYPYRDIIDGDWNDTLLELIPVMLEGTDKLSYELTLAKASVKLGDGHVSFDGSSFLFDTFGWYIAPAKLIFIEGHYVVHKIDDAYIDTCPLKPGDIVVSLNGAKIEDVIDGIATYNAVPSKDKLLPFYRGVLSSQTGDMEITVLRDGAPLKFEVLGYNEYFQWKSAFPSNSHEVLEGSIGLINPWLLLSPGAINRIMTSFTDTEGLIIDLRQYPRSSITIELAEYLVKEPTPYIIYSKPSISIPGLFIDQPPLYSGGGLVAGQYSSGAYYYDKPVVILISETTVSQAETAVMSLRNGTNVTVMGRNTAGSNGDIRSLPLPGGITMYFSAFGIYTPEGEQTQRIGLSPDIYVEQTIVGIQECRDELMEAAVQYIINRNNIK